jgi:hypothetical protein
MKKVVLIISVILLFQIICFGQEKDVCVEIKTVDKIAVGETLKVTADLKVDFLVAPQKLHWQTSKGQKLTTEGFTAQFAINKDDAGKALKISLEFEGLPDNCLRVYEENVEVEYQEPPRCGYKISFPNNGIWNEEKLRLNSEANDFFSKEDATIYKVIETKTPQSKKIAQRKLRIINYLTKEQKIAKKKVIIKVIKSQSEETTYWIVTKGATPPI